MDKERSRKISKYRLWKRDVSKHKGAITLSFVFLIISLIANYLAGRYVNKKISTSVTDIILDNIPPINLSLLFIYGVATIILVLFIYTLFYKPKEFHIALSQFSLLVFIRSIFITLTHLGLPSDAVILDLPDVYRIFTFQNDMFFSAHTAIPFLGFLIFKKEKIRWFFLLSTIIMALTVLFMHVHYSIDVFAALFITYGSYKIGKWLFKEIK
jgi:hypothetical protein